MAKLPILDAAVYCGTYKKYNEGSLDGGWLHLRRYQDGAAFLEACKKLHADESAPEFMYQDSEYLPDEFYSESCIYPEVFEVIQAIKQMNTDKQAAFADFCERGACIPDMFDVEEFLNTYKPNRKPRKTAQSEDMKEFSELLQNVVLLGSYRRSSESRRKALHYLRQTGHREVVLLRLECYVRANVRRSDRHVPQLQRG